MKLSQIKANVQALEAAVKFCTKLYPDEDAAAEELVMVASIIEMCEEMDARLQQILTNEKKSKAAEVLEHLQRSSEKILLPELMQFQRAKMSLDDVKKKPKLTTEKKDRKEPEVPYGTYGEWDFPNGDWARRPRQDEVEAVRLQKLERYPDNALWQTHESCLAWMSVKGFADE